MSYTYRKLDLCERTDMVEVVECSDPLINEKLISICKKKIHNRNVTSECPALEMLKLKLVS